MKAKEAKETKPSKQESGESAGGYCTPAVEWNVSPVQSGNVIKDAGEAQRAISPPDMVVPGGYRMMGDVEAARGLVVDGVWP